MLLNLSLNFAKNIRSSCGLYFLNTIRISRYKTENFKSKATVEKLTEADLTPVNDEDSNPKLSDINHKMRLNRIFRPHDLDFYLNLINKAAENGDLEKLLSVFFHDMLIKDRYRPNTFIVNVILQKLANLGGHSEAAFKIVKKSFDLHLNLTEVTYSLLFKNCSKEIANNELVMSISNEVVRLVSNEELEKIRQPAINALKFVDNLKIKGIDIGRNAVNSLLFTLNKAGMLRESLKVLDEYLNAGFLPTDYTLCAMLEGCVFERENGFGLALLIFNKLVYKYKCEVTPYVFNALLKVVRHCQFGNDCLINQLLDLSSIKELSFQFLTQAESESTSLIPKSNNIHIAQDLFKNKICEYAKNYGLVVDKFVNDNWSHSNNLVNYLKSPTNMIRKKYSNVFDTRWLQSNLEPADKLACVGGILGFLGMMEKNCCKPNMFIFTSLVSCLPYSITKENEDFYLNVLQKLIKHYRLAITPEFQNAILKRNITSGFNENDGVYDVSKFDPYTWSSYSKKCKTSKDVDNFFRLLKSNMCVPNSEMIYALMRSVITWNARLKVMKKMQEHQIEFDREIIVFLEDEIKKYRKKLSLMSPEELENTFVNPFYYFTKCYAVMLDKTGVEAVTTGEKKILINELPSDYYQR